MSFTVTFYEFSKKINSTMRPPSPHSGAGTTYDCILKDSSGIVSPVITVDIGLINPPTGFNYCYIPVFRRYYKVHEWFFHDALWSASLDCDVLASYKTQIGAANLYILRSATFPDGNIIDQKYPLKTEMSEVQVSSSDFAFYGGFNVGRYVLGVLSGGDSETGGVSYYCMTPAEFKNFASQMFSDSNFNIDSIAEDISSDLWKSLFNPYQYISSCVWLPYDYTGGTSVTSIKLGWWEISCSARLITTNTDNKTLTLKIPRHPQAAERGTYLYAAPYSSYKLHALPWGDIPIDATKIVSYQNLVVRANIDLGTGMGILTVYGDNGTPETRNLIATVSSVISVQIPVAQVNSNILGAASSIVGGATGAVMDALTGNIGGAIQAGSSAIGDAVQNLAPSLSGGGTQGSCAAYQAYKITLFGTFYNVAAWDVEHYGRPTMAKHVISTCSGFVQVADGDVSLPATTEECDRVKSFLEEGFYYE